MKIKIVITKKKLLTVLATGLLLAAVIAIGFTAGWYSKSQMGNSVSAPNGQEISDMDISSINMNTVDPADSADVQAIKTMAEQKGAGVAYDYLREQWKDRQTQGHDLSHVVGRIAFLQAGDKSFGICDSNFAFGCFHGLLEELIKQQGEAGFATATAGCNKLQLSGAIASCLHGIGHGVMGSKGDIVTAIVTCQKFGSQEKNYCYDGAYMEYYNGIMTSQAKPKINVADPWQFCLGMLEESQGQCVRNQILFTLYNKSSDIKTAAQSCSALSANLQPYCVPTVGLYAAQTAAGKPDVAQAVCQNFSDRENRVSCIVGAAQEFVFQHFPIDTALQLCQPLDKEGKDRCQKTVDETAAAYGRG